MRLIGLALLLLASPGCGEKPLPPAPPPVSALFPESVPPVPSREPAPPPSSPTPDPPAAPAPEPADPVPPPAAAAPVPVPSEALDAHGLLEAWRGKARQELKGAALELALAQSYLLEGKVLRAHEILKAADPQDLPSEEARTSFRLALAETSARLGDFERAHDLLGESERRLRPLAPLRIAHPCFSASRIRREPIETPVFKGAQQVTLCLDLERLLTPQARDGASARVGFDLTLLEPSGRTVWDFTEWEKSSGILEEANHRPWQDHSYRLTFLLPAGLNLGAYVLKVEASDLCAAPVRKTSTTLALTLR